MSRKLNAQRAWAGGGHRWTPEYLAFVLPLTAEEVFVPASQLGTGATVESRVEWAWINLAQRLSWCYGAAEAVRRLNGGARA